MRPIILFWTEGIFGTTQSGGTDDYGTVFEIPAATHVLDTLASFHGLDGQAPLASLSADANGNFYSTTGSGGAHNDGTVFELSPVIVPEPASLSLLALSSSVLLSRRKRSP